MEKVNINVLNYRYTHEKPTCRIFADRLIDFHALWHYKSFYIECQRNTIVWPQVTRSVNALTRTRYWYFLIRWSEITIITQGSFTCLFMLLYRSINIPGCFHNWEQSSIQFLQYMRMWRNGTWWKSVFIWRQHASPSSAMLGYSVQNEDERRYH